MDSVLVDAVLSSCPDHDPLFRALCWPEGTWPEPERVQALTAFLRGLGSVLADPDNSPVSAEQKRRIRDRSESLIWTQCLPLLTRISADPGGESGRESTASACLLLSACVRLCEPAVGQRVARSLLLSLRGSEEDPLRVEVSSEALTALVPSVCGEEQLTLSLLSGVLSSIQTLPVTVVSRAPVRLLLTLLDSCSGDRSRRVLGSVLEDLCGWYRSGTRTEAVTERALLCLTVVSDHLLTPHRRGPDPRLCPEFWRMVQEGLTHRDSLTRKRALFLLKRCVSLSEEEQLEFPLSDPDPDGTLFRWSPDRSKVLREFWEDYVLVMETLEENQVHVVRPVLNRMDLLIQTTVNDSKDEGVVHPSWLLCVYQRMFHSENKSLMREGVCFLLQLQLLQQQRRFTLAFSQFIVGPFLDVLSESALFHRSVGQSVGERPELGAKLQEFLNTFFTRLSSQHRGHVLLQLIHQLSCKPWCSVPLLFVCQALSSLPSAPLLGQDGLSALREVLRSTMITHQVLLRGAAQGFLLKSALSLSNVKALSLDDVFSFLMHFRSDESLSRGTLIWTQLCSWLMENEGSFKTRIRDGGDQEKETIRDYVQDQIQVYLTVPASTGETDQVPDPKEAERLARAALLCVDLEEGRGGTDVGGTLELLLRPLLDTLSRVSTNVYLPLRKSDRSLQLVLQLCRFSTTPGDTADPVMVALEKLVLRHVDSVQDFLLRRLCGELQEIFDLERADLYLSVQTLLVTLSTSPPRCLLRVQQNVFPKLIRYSISVLSEPVQQVPSVAQQVSRAVAMETLARVCGLVEQEVVPVSSSETGSALKDLNKFFYNVLTQSPSSMGNFAERLLKPHSDDITRDLQVAPLQDWGRVAAGFMRDQWVCLRVLMKTLGLPETRRPPDPLKEALSSSVEALALLPSDLVLPVLAFMETLLPNLLLDEEDLCVEAVMRTWDLVQVLSSNAHDFWSALRGFVSMAFQRQLLEMSHGGATAYRTTLIQISSELMELSQSKSGVFGVLLQHCCQTWLPSVRGGDGGDGDWAHKTFSSVFSYMDLLTEACVYGPVFRRDQRLVQDVQTYVEQLGEECSANVLVRSDIRDDQFPRLCSLALISRLDPSEEQQQKLMEVLALALIQKDNELSKSKLRTYSNTLEHRVKNRVWQTLLLLIPKLREDFVESQILDPVFKAGFCSNQASVKYLMEWTMILILIRFPQHVDRFWTCFNMDHEKTKTSICTFLSVLVHFNIILPNLHDQGSQITKALDVILRWCFTHNFSVRLYALLALKRVWSLACEWQVEDGTDRFGGLSTVIQACLNQAEAMQSTGNANKNWTRIQDHFFFSTFHPVRDYSLETIFLTFPSLSDVADDEWIPLWKFEKLSCFSESPRCPLKNPHPDLGRVQPGDWIQQDKSEQEKEERWAEVQKKITPWRLGIQDQEPDLHGVPAERAARLGKQQGALLVVASLIHKATNLGGLCRTCEIFGARALVLNSLRHLSDKNFQSLSVSSELWLPLLEVKPVELSVFLQQKKSEGYCIVGVEQTVKSRSLETFQFPEKTLLLLGNEREGIPADLLQLLDVCVEIPQRGVIRSLNVHVSAALLVWEYTRQHLGSGVQTELG